MKFAHRIIFSSCFLVFCVATGEAKSWRGIVPARSNRDDVARVVNQPISSDTFRFRYESPIEVVEFLFSGRETYASDCEKALPLGTVLLIDIRPKTELRLVDLQLDKTRLKELEPSGEFIIDGHAYVDEDKGFVTTTSNGIVQRIVYIAAREDQQLCATYYQEPRRFANRILCILCPTIAVSSPDEARAGEPVYFAVKFTSDVGAHPTILWKVDAGTIIMGQGTDLITVDSTGLGGKTIKATVEIGGIDPSCSNQAMSETLIRKP